MFAVFCGDLLIGLAQTVQAGQEMALEWWQQQSGVEALAGNWLDTVDHQAQQKVWFFVPELSTLEALVWTMPSCEVRCAA